MSSVKTQIELDQRKKKVFWWSAGGVPLVAILSWMGTNMWGWALDWKDTVDADRRAITKEIITLKQKIDNDESQWRMLHRYNEKLQAMEVQLQVQARLIDILQGGAHRN